MMAYTDRHFRYMARLFSKRTLLYTEMVVAETIHHNRHSSFLQKILQFHPSEHPLAVQLGGDNPCRLREAARICEDHGYDEVNLNVGCPSDRVQKGRFGACLMKEPQRVAEILGEMRAAVSIPVTVKHRLGVDDLDQYEALAGFIETVAQSGVDTFIIHARKAWLKGLSPAQNRNVPPLRYEWVHRIKQDFPHLSIITNGGIHSMAEALTQLEHVDGVMIGRAAYHQPQILAEADTIVFGEAPEPALSSEALIEAMQAYVCDELQHGTKLSFTLKHLVGLFKCRPNSRKWRQAISKLVQEKPTRIDLLALYRNIFGEKEPEGEIRPELCPSA